MSRFSRTCSSSSCCCVLTFSMLSSSDHMSQESFNIPNMFADLDIARLALPNTVSSLLKSPGLESEPRPTAAKTLSSSSWVYSGRSLAKSFFTKSLLARQDLYGLDIKSHSLSKSCLYLKAV